YPQVTVALHRLPPTALEEAAVEQHVGARRADQVHGTRDGLGCAQGDDFDHFASSGAWVGTHMRNVVPSPGSLRNSRLPPWATKTARATESPKPVPRSFVVKKGSNTSVPAGIPGPWSRTSMHTFCSLLRARIRSEEHRSELQSR